MTHPDYKKTGWSTLCICLVLIDSRFWVLWATLELFLWYSEDYLWTHLSCDSLYKSERDKKIKLIDRPAKSPKVYWFLEILYLSSFEVYFTKVQVISSLVGSTVLQQCMSLEPWAYLGIEIFSMSGTYFNRSTPRSYYCSRSGW